MKKCEACGYDLSVDSAHVCTNWQLREGPGIPARSMESPLIVTRNGVPEPDQKAAVEAFKSACLAEPKTAEPKADDINRPAHYTSGKVECIDAIESALTPEEFRGFLKGNVIKYTWRERQKEGDKAMGKARWYLDRLLGAKQ